VAQIDPPVALSEIGVAQLDMPVAQCVFRVWEHDAPKRPGATAEKVLKTLRAFWPKQTDPLLLVARQAAEVVGFRFGHALPDEGGRRIFWDADGGVIPLHRRKGIGRTLLREQHRIVSRRGYRCIRTSTALPLKPMIILNLLEGFDIIGLEAFRGDGWQVKALVFEKKLDASGMEASADDR
jgi:GNAT superfamily N-acetyltransferase